VEIESAALAYSWKRYTVATKSVWLQVKYFPTMPQKRYNYLHAITYSGGLGLKTWWFGATVNKRNISLLYALPVIYFVIQLHFTVTVNMVIQFSPGLCGVIFLRQASLKFYRKNGCLDNFLVVFGQPEDC